MQIGLFYSRQVNLVSKTPCFTHGPDQNSVPVCEKADFTHGKWNLVCETPCSTHGPDQIGVRVCEKATFTHGPTIPCAKPRVLLTVLTKMKLRFIPPLASHSTERRHRPQKCLWSHIQRSME